MFDSWIHEFDSTRNQYLYLFLVCTKILFHQGILLKKTSTFL